MKFTVKSIIGASIFRIARLSDFFVAEYIKSSLLSCGKNVKLKKKVMIDFPNKVTLGDYTMIGQYSHLRGGGGIEIGEWCQISSFVNISTVNHNINGKRYYNNVSYERIKIGNNVWIGTNATILPGVEVGDNSIIAAGAVVTKSIPPNSIAVGIPAKIAGSTPETLF